MSITKEDVLAQLRSARLQSLERYYNGQRLKEQAEKELIAYDTAIDAAGAPTALQVPNVAVPDPAASGHPAPNAGETTQ